MNRGYRSKTKGGKHAQLAMDYYYNSPGVVAVGFSYPRAGRTNIYSAGSRSYHADNLVSTANKNQEVAVYQIHQSN
jgi:hypothetical protein